MTPTRARRKFPQLDNTHIKYCSIFYEGMHDDSRTNLALALTAAAHEATILNYCEVTALTRPAGQTRVTGAIVCDRVTGAVFTVRAKAVLICGGPFTDELRRMEQLDGSRFTPAVTGSSGSLVYMMYTCGYTSLCHYLYAGVHIVLPAYFAPPSFGFVDMSTSDGRFLFFLPWQVCACLWTYIRTYVNMLVCTLIVLRAVCRCCW
jgi:glycerol-3-phosphate dehydrogenase